MVRQILHAVDNDDEVDDSNPASDCFDFDVFEIADDISHFAVPQVRRFN